MLAPRLPESSERTSSSEKSEKPEWRGNARPARLRRNRDSTGAAAVGARPRGVDLAAIEAGALFRIAQETIGRRNILELPLGALVAGIEVGMQLLGQAAIGLLDIIRGSRLVDAENFSYGSVMPGL